jgi:hypothetical protein
MLKVLKEERILPRVAKPGRYTGGEYNQVVKNWDEVGYKVALAFPDIYDIGMSNLGLMILYDIINKHKNLLAERVYCPWTTWKHHAPARHPRSSRWRPSTHS